MKRCSKCKEWKDGIVILYKLPRLLPPMLRPAALAAACPARILSVRVQQVRQIVDLKADGMGATDISRSVNTSVPNVYRILKRVKEGDIVLK